jgi:hypothetical protein
VWGFLFEKNNLLSEYPEGHHGATIGEWGYLETKCIDFTIIRKEGF